MYDKTCRYCKTTLSEFYATGMLGCKHCYTAFRPEIEIWLNKYQYKPFHVGKIPSISGEEKHLLDEYKNLIAEKEKAALESRFSDMAKIAQEIFSLKQELIKRGLIE